MISETVWYIGWTISSGSPTAEANGSARSGGLTLYKVLNLVLVCAQDVAYALVNVTTWRHKRMMLEYSEAHGETTTCQAMISEGSCQEVVIDVTVMEILTVPKGEIILKCDPRHIRGIARRRNDLNIAVERTRRPSAVLREYIRDGELKKYITRAGPRRLTSHSHHSHHQLNQHSQLQINQQSISTAAKIEPICSESILLSQGSPSLTLVQILYSPQCWPHGCRCPLRSSICRGPGIRFQRGTSCRTSS